LRRARRRTDRASQGSLSTRAADVRPIRIERAAMRTRKDTLRFQRPARVMDLP
jgi:hypothetical protein